MLHLCSLYCASGEQSFLQSVPALESDGDKAAAAVEVPAADAEEESAEGQCGALVLACMPRFLINS